MINQNLIPVAFAAGEENETVAITEHASETSEHADGLKIEPSMVAFHALNFLVLLVVLHKILYKPLLKLLKEREQRIKEGVENAEKADGMLKESQQIRVDMIKNAKVESQTILELARKSAEELKNGILHDANLEAEKIITTGQNHLEMERLKTLQELKGKAVDLVILAAEKILKEKIDSKKDAQLIEEGIKSYSL